MAFGTKFCCSQCHRTLVITRHRGSAATAEADNSPGFMGRGSISQWPRIASQRELREKQASTFSILEFSSAAVHDRHFNETDSVFSDSFAIWRRFPRIESVCSSSSKLFSALSFPYFLFENIMCCPNRLIDQRFPVLGDQANYCSPHYCTSVPVE